MQMARTWTTLYLAKKLWGAKATYALQVYILRVFTYATAQTPANSHNLFHYWCGFLMAYLTRTFSQTYLTRANAKNFGAKIVCAALPSRSSGTIYSYAAKRFDELLIKCLKFSEMRLLKHVTNIPCPSSPAYSRNATFKEESFGARYKQRHYIRIYSRKPASGHPDAFFGIWTKTLIQMRATLTFWDMLVVVVIYIRESDEVIVKCSLKRIVFWTLGRATTRWAFPVDRICGIDKVALEM